MYIVVVVAVVVVLFVCMLLFVCLLLLVFCCCLTSCHFKQSVLSQHLYALVQAMYIKRSTCLVYGHVTEEE